SQSTPPPCGEGSRAGAVWPLYRGFRHPLPASLIKGEVPAGGCGRIVHKTGTPMPRTHATLPRLYVEPDLAAGGQLTLGKEQSLYLAAVLRKSVGDEVVLFNGRDGAWRCALTSDSKKSVGLE